MEQNEWQREKVRRRLSRRGEQTGRHGQQTGERAQDHGFDEIWRKGVGWFVATGTRKRGWEVLQGEAATVQVVKSVKSLEASRKAYREGRIEFRTEEPSGRPRARSFGEGSAPWNF